MWPTDDRASEWSSAVDGNGDDGNLELREDQLKKVGIDVDKTVLQNAVNELLSE